MKSGDVYRYVLVKFAFERPAWYLDPTDSVEEKDFVLVHTVTANLKERWEQ